MDNLDAGRQRNVAIFVFARRGSGRACRVAMYLERGRRRRSSPFCAISRRWDVTCPSTQATLPCRVAEYWKCAARAVVKRAAIGPGSQRRYRKRRQADHLALHRFSYARRTHLRPPPGPRPVVRQERDIAYTIFHFGIDGKHEGVSSSTTDRGELRSAAFDAYGVRSDDRVHAYSIARLRLEPRGIVVTLTAGAALVVRSARPIESGRVSSTRMHRAEPGPCSASLGLWKS